MENDFIETSGGLISKEEMEHFGIHMCKPKKYIVKRHRIDSDESEENIQKKYRVIKKSR